MTADNWDLEVRDVAPRDGLQDIPTLIAADKKVDLVERLYACGIRAIEVTSFVSASRVPQLADADEVCRAVNELNLDGAVLSAFVPNERGLERAQSAGVHEISTAVPVTDAMSTANFGRPMASVLAEVCRFPAAVDGLSTSATVAVAFGCPFEGRVALASVVSIVEQLVDAGYRRVLLGDTIGIAEPNQVARTVSALRERYPEILLGAHFHDARGAGLANVASAVREGVTLLDSSLGGIGGCPFSPGAAGNVATEDMTAMLSAMGYHLGCRLA